MEGHGEVAAVPILIRRIANQVAPTVPLEVLRPIRIKRQRLLKAGELERAMELAARQVGSGGAICCCSTPTVIARNTLPHRSSNAPARRDQIE